MSTQYTPPARTTIVASLLDYIEQLREEGLDGLPAVNPPPSALAGPQPRTAAVAAAGASGKPARMPNPPDEKKLTVKRDDSAGQPQSFSTTPANAATELFYRYPGLEKTTDLDTLREFIGACTRGNLAPGRTNLVFGAGNPNAELMFVGEAPGADEDLQ